MAVSDLTYDILTVLQSKLEAVSAMDIYVEDCDEAGDDRCRELFEEIRRDDDRHVETLRAEVERRAREGVLT